MALPDLQRQLVDSLVGNYCKNKVPAHLREELFNDYKIRGNSVVIFESRRNWQDHSLRTEIVVAQFRFDSKTSKWALYCADRNSRWHIYDLVVPTKNLQELIDQVEEDKTGIFWG